MAKVHPQPNVFGYNPSKQKSSTKEVDINREIANATAAIQASVADSSSNRAIYLVSGTALLIIAALSHSLYSQSTQLSNINQYMSRSQEFQGHDIIPFNYDGSASDTRCLDIISSSGKDFASKLADAGNYFTQSYESEEIRSSTYAATLSKIVKGKTLISRLIEAGCPNTVMNFESGFRSLSKEVLKTAIASCDKIRNIALRNIFEPIYANLITSLDEHTFPRSFAMTDPVGLDALTCKVVVECADGRRQDVWSNQGAISNLESHFTDKHRLDSENYQQQLQQAAGFNSYITSYTKKYLDEGKGEEAAKFIKAYISGNPDAQLRTIQVLQENGITFDVKTQTCNYTPAIEGSSKKEISGDSKIESHTNKQEGSKDIDPTLDPEDDPSFNSEIED